MKNQYDIIVKSEQGEEIAFIISVDGLFMYKDRTSIYDSVFSFATDYVNNSYDFNECYGAYRFRMTRKGASEEVLFSDNSGMMRFYFNRDENSFYSSLSETKQKKERKPNYSSIAQFLCYGCVYGEETIVKSVALSNPNCYYVLINHDIEIKTKQLTPLSEYKTQNTFLNLLIRRALTHSNGKIGCTITGGIDSRTILANLIHIGSKPQLAVTGHESQPDVEIAKKISEAINLELSVISDDIEESDWLDNSIEAADGQEGICGIYRLDKLARYLVDKGIDLQFGGVNGEMYKNSFINQDFPFYFGYPRWKRFYKYKVGTFDLNLSMFTKPMQDEIRKLPSGIIEWLKTHTGRNKADAYLNAGYEIMQARCNHVINMFQKHTTIYNPLMERRMAAYAFGVNPYTLEMQSFQRKEVSISCSEIKNIETDRGLTCNYSRRTLEFYKSNGFLIKVALQRMLFRNKIDIRIDNCFKTGHTNDHFDMALCNVKGLGILDEKTDIKNLPDGLADRLFTIGLFFET